MTQNKTSEELVVEHSEDKRISTLETDEFSLGKEVTELERMVLGSVYYLHLRSKHLAIQHRKFRSHSSHVST